MKRSTHIFAALFLLQAFVACSGLPKSPYPYEHNAALLQRALSGVTVLGKPIDLSELPAVDVLATDENMRAFVSRWLAPRQGTAGKVRDLLNAVESRGVLGVYFNEAATGTASQAFYNSAANCVAFSNLIVALAREAGMTAKYQDVLVMPKWELAGDLASLQRHINVKIINPRGEDYIVDFSPDRQTSIPLEATTIGDDEAAAQYFNNIAINHLYDKDYRAAFLNVRKALELHPRSSFIWSNLGVILGRAGADNESEAALHKAIALKPATASAFANLSALYARRGEAARAAYYGGEIERHRSQNPFYLLIKAREAFAKNAFDDTLSLLRRAQAIKPREALFFELRSRVLLAQGEQDKAATALRKAIRYAPVETQRNKYIAELDALSGKKDSKAP